MCKNVYVSKCMSVSILVHIIKIQVSVNIGACVWVNEYANMYVEGMLMCMFICVSECEHVCVWLNVFFVCDSVSTSMCIYVQVWVNVSVYVNVC